MNRPSLAHLYADSSELNSVQNSALPLSKPPRYPTPTPTAFPTDSAPLRPAMDLNGREPNRQRERLKEFYAVHAPQKVQDIERILAHFYGKYDVMWEKLIERYGDGPEPVSVPSTERPTGSIEVVEGNTDDQISTLNGYRARSAQVAERPSSLQEQQQQPSGVPPVAANPRDAERQQYYSQVVAGHHQNEARVDVFRQLQELQASLEKKTREVQKLRSALVNRACSPTNVELETSNSSALCADNPPELKGLPLDCTFPLELSHSTHHYFHAELWVLGNDEKASALFKKVWKRRFVVADSRGITIFREENDFRRHSYHKAIVSTGYSNFSFFVPCFSSSIGLASHAQTAALYHPYAIDSASHYFGFVAKQPVGADPEQPVNPSIVFRTESIQEYIEWSHYFAKTFNRNLYKQLFSDLFVDAAETVPGAPVPSTHSSVGTQVEAELVAPVTAQAPINTNTENSGTHNVTQMLSSPPPPEGRPPEGTLRSAEDTTVLPQNYRLLDEKVQQLQQLFHESSGDTTATMALGPLLEKAFDSLSEKEKLLTKERDRSDHLKASVSSLEAELVELRRDRSELQTYAAALQSAIETLQKDGTKAKQLLEEQQNLSSEMKVTIQTMSSKLHDAEKALETVSAQEKASVMAAEHQLRKQQQQQQPDKVGCDMCPALERQLKRALQERSDMQTELKTKTDEHQRVVSELCNKAVNDMDTLHEVFRSEISKRTDASLPPVGPKSLAVLLQVLRADLSANASTLQSSSKERNKPPPPPEFEVRCGIASQGLELLSWTQNKPLENAEKSKREWKVRDHGYGVDLTLSVEIKPVNTAAPSINAAAERNVLAADLQRSAPRITNTKKPPRAALFADKSQRTEAKGIKPTKNVPSSRFVHNNVEVAAKQTMMDKELLAEEATRRAAYWTSQLHRLRRGSDAVPMDESNSDFAEPNNHALGLHPSTADGSLDVDEYNSTQMSNSTSTPAYTFY